jgi:hypothetical protein
MRVVVTGHRVYIYPFSRGTCIERVLTSDGGNCAAART